jgi:2-methylisocitrate lyase-like PEP mutase family enzyme
VTPVPTQAEKGATFRSLHERDRAFIIPNPWDVGTARLLAGLGFEALATTSAGYAFSAGRRDNSIGRDEMMRHASAIASASDLPVSIDLENGYGDAPEIVADTIRLAAATGVVGGSIEDATGNADVPIYGSALSRAALGAFLRAAREMHEHGSFAFAEQAVSYREISARF